MKLMLDTQIYDLIVDTPGMTERLNELSREGKVVVLSTHIQEDELAEIPDKRKRAAVARIVKEKVPTSGAIWDISRWDEGTWGDGSSGGMSIDEVRSPSAGHGKDALIATTAARDADILVTNDTRLANRVRTLDAPFDVWSFDEFREYVFSVKW